MYPDWLDGKMGAVKSERIDFPQIIIEMEKQGWPKTILVLSIIQR